MAKQVSMTVDGTFYKASLSSSQLLIQVELHCSVVQLHVRHLPSAFISTFDIAFQRNASPHAWLASPSEAREPSAWSSGTWNISPQLPWFCQRRRMGRQTKSAEITRFERCTGREQTRSGCEPGRCQVTKAKPGNSNVTCVSRSIWAVLLASHLRLSFCRIIGSLA